MDIVLFKSSSQVLVSRITSLPLFSTVICLSISYSRDFSTVLKEFIFFNSVFVPNSFCPTGLIEILASQRREPSSILQSETPRYCRVCFREFRNFIASSELLKSGSRSEERR